LLSRLVSVTRASGFGIPVESNAVVGKNSPEAGENHQQAGESKNAISESYLFIG
tara:strand:+ start:270 stop:431 length:162 start_codon:yes stop_codon:yes gene_type:complete